MKKFLAVLVLGLLWCNVGFADLTLYCKQEIRILINKDGVTETIPMKQDWKFIITETEIHVSGFEMMYDNLMRRDNSDETTYFGADKTMYYPDGSGVSFATSIQISRTTGEGFLYQVISNHTTKQPFKCSAEKPKLLF